jgi:RNA polymerase sigma-70 factor, ECF subfamily
MMDAQLETAIQAVKSGDLDAYAQVVSACQRRLRASVALKCPPGVDPDEIAHMAFVEAYKRIDQFQPGTDFYVWAWVFARNLLLAELKKRKRQARNRENYAAEMVADAMESELAQDADEGESYLDALQHCLSGLPEQARTLVRMRYDQGFSLAAAAKSFGKTISALKFQMFAIRRALRDCVRKNLPAVEA